MTNLNVGSVAKLDGSYAAVHYPALDDEELPHVDISKCRLLRKEELVVSSVNRFALVLYFFEYMFPQKCSSSFCL